MKTIPLPDSAMLPMDHIADGVKGLRIILTNVFGITAPNGDWALVDAALPGSGRYIRSWAGKHFKGKPAAIFLTHGHFDHTGALESLRKHWGEVPIFAHELEIRHLTGKASYPAPDPSVGGGLIALLSPLYPRSPIDLGNRVRPFKADGTLPGFGTWRCSHTPGHTAGHVSFFREADRTLLVGDAFCTTKPESLSRAIDQEPELSGPPSYYTSDWNQARTSVQKLAKLQPNVVAPGHGRPLKGPAVTAALDRMAANFDKLARPEHGKYANQS